MSSVLKSRAFGLLFLPVCAAAQTGFRYFDLDDTAAAPRRLSQTGLYSDIRTKAMIPAAVRFDVNSPLWSDASQKTRWILLRNNASVTFREKDDYWDYPESTVFIKQFAIDTVPGDTASRTLWETRLLINRKEHPGGDTSLPRADAWYGYSYQWRRDQSDADLVSLEGGKNDTLRVYPDGRGRPAAWKKWHYPSQSECRKCHVPTIASTQSRSVLGFFTAQLNRRYWRGTGNQLDTLFARGALKGTKADWSLAPRWYAVNDSTSPGQTVDKRARAYIAANCSGCHGVRGNANHASAFVSFVYDFHTGVPQDTLKYRSVRQGSYVQDAEPTSVAPGLVVPGYPQKSLLLYRQAQRNTTPGSFTPLAAEMPPLASYEPNQEALNLITRWIKEMDTVHVGVQIGDRANGAGGRKTARVQGRVFLLPPGLVAAAEAGNAAARIRVFMTGVDGRTWELAETGPGRYALPAEAARGVYAFRAGGRAFLRQLL